MMGTYLWVIRQVIRAPDGVAIGTLKHHKTFTPWVGLSLRNYGIFRDPEIDKDGEEIVAVSSVHTPDEPALDFFQVDLTEERATDPIAETVVFYGPDFSWTFYPNPPTVHGETSAP